MITYRQKINVSAGGKLPKVFLSQRDTNATIVFDLYASDGEFTLQLGTTVQCCGTRSDGQGVTIPGTLDIERKTVTISITQELTAVAGRGVFELVFTHSGDELHTSNFMVYVERAA